MSLREICGEDPNYAVVKKLGAGAFGEVYQVHRKSDGKVLACKVLQLEIVRMKDGSAEVQKKSIVDEVVSLRKLAGCRNIIQWEPDVAFDSRRQTIQLYMEFYPDGDLEGFIEKHPAGLIPKDTVTQVFCCLAMALLDCHSRGICHSDIKPANVLLSRKMWNGQTVTVAYLADFGITRQSSKALTSGECIFDTRRSGTPAFMAPELLDDNPVYSERSDVFALGCTMYEVFNRKTAYNSWARDSVPSISFAAQREYGSRLCSLVTSLMAYSPQKRPGTQQLVDSLEAYCVSRWEKQKASMLWETLTVVSKGNSAGIAPPLLPPWEQRQQPRQNFQLPPALQAIGQQQRQQQPPMMPPALLQARQAHQVHQQRVTTLMQVQTQAVLEQEKRRQQQQQQQQFGGVQPPWNQTRKS